MARFGDRFDPVSVSVDCGPFGQSLETYSEGTFMSDFMFVNISQLCSPLYAPSISRQLGRSCTHPDSPTPREGSSGTNRSPVNISIVGLIWHGDHSPSSCWTKSFWTRLPHLTPRWTRVARIRFASRKRAIITLAFLPQFSLVREQIRYQG